MSGMLDYLKWRGDLSFESDPINEVDNLIFCRLSYLPFEDVLGVDFSGSISLKDALQKVQSARQEFEEEKDKEEKYLNELHFISSVAESIRFNNLDIISFTCIFDEEKQQQFSATTFFFNNSIFIAFRGTDDSLVGLKEDFNMNFISPIPSQIEGVKYLNKVSNKISEIYLGGHSKGGNIAIYAGAFCKNKIRKKIKKIYNNDGPGFSNEIVESTEYLNIEERIITLIPQTSIIGLMLENRGKYSVISSSNRGLLQHDLFSWEVSGKEIVRVEEVDKLSRYFDATLDDWLRGINQEERQKFIDILYDIITSANFKKTSDLSQNPIKSTAAIIKAYASDDKENREVISTLLKSLFKIAGSNLFSKEI
ncbi:MAG: DUF2974 domain-containing protein [Ruminococcaceae bacterium]|nr:DUF2974 domain-containing protein [Oscillospiraceae bacterium]